MRLLRTVILAGCAAWASPALAVDTYEDCTAMVEKAPAQAEAAALAWAQAGGGAAAVHCRALALMAQGADQQAAKLLIGLATDDRTLPDAVRAQLLIDAGQLFLGLGELKAADDAAERALSLGGDKRPGLTLTARLKAERRDWPGAIADLDKALAAGQPDAQLLTLRASAKLKLGRQVAARDDILWATELAPKSPSVWLERGSLEQATGNVQGARDAWLKAIALDSEGTVAEAARLRLQKMDSGG